MPRFVLLEHDHPRGRHVDFMLERDDALWTWALPASPDFDGSLQATRLPDHRKAYLEYEGPVSNDRGHVRRIDEGEYAFVVNEADRIVVDLRGRALIGRLAMEHVAEADDAWFVHFESRGE